ncbi:hypothetical protein [Hyalangium rubrum]|uniref:Outer membrane protein beta-barrel domain-containing protein n=1 Tax=Hyalangium rubrum TaxID=3103134 RepID=A0ABU5HF87_9BACT|nr:hypothetical protein [Hyalangium sp. s54d21]MDY7232146.1 hypothetical protein [Hyalangium sp. s54d21]
MSRNRLFLLLLHLVALPAFAEDKESSEYEDASEYEEEEAKNPSLEGSRRFSLQTGWRYTPNTRFFDNFYARQENRGLTRAGGALGGPLLAGTFAYSPQNWLEVGFDLFFTYERMQLTKKPGLNAITFGAILGLRLQRRLELGSKEFIPFVGALVGPTFAGAYFDGGQSVENFAHAFGATAGGTLRLSSKWGLCVEYRLTYAKGQAERLGTYDAGGSWLAVGLTYVFPTAQDRPLSRNF